MWAYSYDLRENYRDVGTCNLTENHLISSYSTSVDIENIKSQHKDNSSKFV